MLLVRSFTVGQPELPRVWKCVDTLQQLYLFDGLVDIHVLLPLMPSRGRRGLLITIAFQPFDVESEEAGNPEVPKNKMSGASRARQVVSLPAPALLNPFDDLGTCILQIRLTQPVALACAGAVPE